MEPLGNPFIWFILYLLKFLFYSVPIIYSLFIIILYLYKSLIYFYSFSSDPFIRTFILSLQFILSMFNIIWKVGGGGCFNLFFSFGNNFFVHIILRFAFCDILSFFLA